MKRAMVAEVMTIHALSQRRACELIGIKRRGFQRAPPRIAIFNCVSGCGSWPNSGAGGVVRCSI